MVDSLCRLDPASYGRKYKLVYQIPLAVDFTSIASSEEAKSHKVDSRNQSTSGKASNQSIVYRFGGLLDEIFLSTSHAKFHTAISTAAVAPCTIGKSNMFRRSHLNALMPSSDQGRRSPGIDFFSQNIYEDSLIGDLLWKTAVPSSVVELTMQEGEANSGTKNARPVRQGSHALLPTPPCIQPVTQLSTSTYAARRTRWLWVRKFTVPLATGVEPGTEPLFCTFYGAFGLTTNLWYYDTLSIL